MHLGFNFNFLFLAQVCYDFLLCFLLDILIVLGLIFRSVIHFKVIFVYGAKSQGCCGFFWFFCFFVFLFFFFFFCNWVSSCPSIFVENTVFLTLDCPDTLVRSQLTIYDWIVSGLYSVLISIHPSLCLYLTVFSTLALE